LGSKANFVTLLDANTYLKVLTALIKSSKLGLTVLTAGLGG